MNNFKALLAKAKESDSYHIEAAKLDFIIGINRIMKIQGLKNKDLAEKIGVMPAAISKVMSGNQAPTIKTMVKIALALGHNISFKFEELS